jgi:hypothetical protein
LPGGRRTLWIAAKGFRAPRKMPLAKSLRI